VLPDAEIAELLSLPAGLGQAVTVTFQGLVEDDCSQETVPISITNGFVLRIL